MCKGVKQLIINMYEPFNKIDGTPPPILNLPKLPENLLELSVLNQQISQFPVLPKGLQALNLSGVYLSGVVSNLPPSLKYLSLAFNHIEHIISFPPELIFINIQHNLFITHLPKLPATLQVLVCSYNSLLNLVNLQDTQLQYLICDRNKLIQLGPFPQTLMYLDCRQNPISTISDLPPKVMYAAMIDTQLPSDRIRKIENKVRDERDKNPQINVSIWNGVYMPHGYPPILNIPLPKQNLHINISDAPIPKDAVGVNIELGDDVNVCNYLAESPDHFTIRVKDNDKYVVFDKKNILPSLERNSYYPCKRAVNRNDTVKPEDVIPTNKYFLSNLLGVVFTKDGMVSADGLKTAFNMPDVCGVELINIGKNAPSMIKVDLYRRAGAAGARCPPMHTELPIYKIALIKRETDIGWAATTPHLNGGGVSRRHHHRRCKSRRTHKRRHSRKRTARKRKITYR